MFCYNIKRWFLENHNIEINFDTSQKVNVGLSDFDDQKLSSDYFLNLLTENEKDRILELNSIDLQIYNFVKNKEATNV